jgi:serine/threonine protein kinase
MAKTLEDITKTPMSTTLKDHDGARWMAPEVIEDESPSKASDAYSFAMSILEMLTEKPPLYEHKRDLTIIRIMAMEGPIRPKRPMAPEVMHWLTNEVWELLERCWTIEPAARPTMEDLMLDLKEISSPLTMVL